MNQVLTPQDKKALSDVSVIIKMMPKYLRNRIPFEFVEFVEKNKEGKSEINENIPLKEQKISKYTKVYVGVIYREFLISEQKRKELIEKENEIFKVKFDKININENQNLELVEFKNQTWYQKLFAKIMEFWEHVQKFQFRKK